MRHGQEPTHSEDYWRQGHLQKEERHGILLCFQRGCYPRHPMQLSFTIEIDSQSPRAQAEVLVVRTSLAAGHSGHPATCCLTARSVSGTKGTT